MKKKTTMKKGKMSDAKKASVKKTKISNAADKMFGSYGK